MEPILMIALCESVMADARRLIMWMDCLEVAAEICHFQTGEAFLASKPGGKYDLVFISLQLTGLSGMETARALRRADECCAIALTSANRQHMPEAFEVGARHYLVKPIEQDAVKNVLQAELKSRNTRGHSCVINARGRRVELNFNSISHIEVFNHRCVVHTAQGLLETGTTMTITSFMCQLPSPPFIRCHKSFIVNMNHVQKVEHDFIMKDGSTVYIRRADAETCAEAFHNWQKEAEAGRYRTR